jgi:IS1 family transposase
MLWSYVPGVSRRAEHFPDIGVPLIIAIGILEWLQYRRYRKMGIKFPPALDPEQQATFARLWGPMTKQEMEEFEKDAWETARKDDVYWRRYYAQLKQEAEEGRVKKEQSRTARKHKKQSP